MDNIKVGLSDEIKQQLLKKAENPIFDIESFQDCVLWLDELDYFYDYSVRSCLNTLKLVALWERYENSEFIPVPRDLLDETIDIVDFVSKLEFKED